MSADLDVAVEEYEEGALEAALAAEEDEVAEEVAEEVLEETVAEELIAEEALAEDEPELEDEEEDDDNEGVQDHLKDAVEGTLRLKRLLSSDDQAPDELLESAGLTKRRKIKATQGPEEQAKVKKLLTKWGLLQDQISGHVLEGLNLKELEVLDASGYVPDKFNQWKSPAELIAKTVAELRERNGPGGGPVDPIAAFRFRWNLPQTVDAQLRKLSHKDLRYVLREYNGVGTLEDHIEVASSSAPEEFATGAIPEAHGVSTVGRFNRLELIDPLADAAVFGDANLSFALKLAKHRKALGHVGRVIATTFEPLDTLRERYTEIDSTIKELEEHYAEVYHGVDCTRIAVDPRFQGMEESLGAVYYNYPHAGAVSGFFDGHPLVNWRHENLMRLFFRALRSFVKPGGWVKVSSNMGAVGVRYSYIIGSAIENEFLHVETVPFLEWHLHRYGRSYGDRRDQYKRPGQGQGYNVQRAEADMLYTFQYSPSGEPLGQQKIRLPPKFGTLTACTDGPFKAMLGESKKKLAMQLYKRFVTEVSGTHVG